MKDVHLAIVQWGNVAEWIQALGPFGRSLFRALFDRRVEGAEQWVKDVEELSGLNGSGVEAVLERNPFVAQVVEAALEAASRTAWADKRRLLARTVAATLRNPNDATAEHASFLIRTLSALDASHVRVLTTIATPEASRGQRAGTRLEGYATVQDLIGFWPGGEIVLPPVLGVLMREGLLADKAVGTWDYVPAYGLTGYGRRFLEFMIEAEPWMEFADRVEVTLRYEPQKSPLDSRLFVRNLGPGSLCQAKLTIGQGTNSRTLDLQAEEELEVLNPAPGTSVVSWRDGRGTHERSMVINEEPVT